jgi:hypothetical protein
MRVGGGVLIDLPCCHVTTHSPPSLQMQVGGVSLVSTDPPCHPLLLGVDLVSDRLYPEAKLISSWGSTQLHYLDIYLQTCVYLKDAGIGITCNKEDRENARYVIIEKRVITGSVTEETAEAERLPKIAEVERKHI